MGVGVQVNEAHVGSITIAQASSTVDNKGPKKVGYHALADGFVLCYS